MSDPAAAKTEENGVTSPPGGAKDNHNVQFPWRLHELLDEVDSSIISWLPEGTAFKVHNKTRFTEEILPSYFNATKYKSFQRNLNLWGFETIHEGPNKGGCFHPLFQKGNRDKCHYMSRQKVKGANGKLPKTPGMKMPLAPGAKQMPTMIEMVIQANPSLAPHLKDTKTSKLTAEELKALPLPKKLHHILAQPQFTDCIGWTPDGRCIRVIDPFKFQEKIKAYFDHTSFSSFLVELESYGFQRVSSHLGFQECYYHDFMIRGCPHLCKYIPDAESSKKFMSTDVAKDLEIDQAFGIPSFTPQLPGLLGAPPANMMNGAYMGDPAAAMEMQQRQQQMAALQLMATGGIVPNAALMGGLNPALLGMGGRGPMPGMAPSGDQTQSSTPISNYLANSQQGGNKSGGSRPEAV
eukprot:CAMPEP_0176022560 /NCGR_PEP_ID=MMETSP0120_2-20121206/10984_1 /TAXON_ID=160619 /ORGANISM="Kryptoperidinium foliaceum, Strain CCMP 1326" /LENGTH=407 /DNA_ID=CAMNT_0017355701 /DNA_START=109 /DNA_END=1332 /DNA_ORIENTATION=+